jgi:DNA-binding NtrC family response regulator
VVPQDEEAPMSDEINLAGSLRVLLVDDEPVLFPILRRIIERARPDAVVVYASDVASAQWQIEFTSLRLVLTDMCLGDDLTGGFRVAELAKAAGVPVIAITGAGPEILDELTRREVPVIRKQAMSQAELTRIVTEAFA